MLLHVGSGLGAEGRDTRNDALLGLGLVMLGNVLVFRKPKPVLAEARA